MVACVQWACLYSLRGLRNHTTVPSWQFDLQNCGSYVCVAVFGLVLLENRSNYFFKEEWEVEVGPPEMVVGPRELEEGPRELEVGPLDLEVGPRPCRNATWNTHTHTHATSFTFCINKHALLVEFGLSIKPRVCISALLDSTLQVSCFGLTASVPSSHSVLFPVPYRFTPNVPGIPSVVSDVPNKTHSRLHPVIPFQGGDSSKSNHCCVVSFWRILIAHNVKVTAAMQTYDRLPAEWIECETHDNTQTSQVGAVLGPTSPCVPCTLMYPSLHPSLCIQQWGTFDQDHGPAIPLPTP